MKRILCLLLSISLFCCGCAKKSSDVELVTSNLSFNTKITYFDQTYEYSVKISDNGDMEIKKNPIEQPQIIYNFTSEELTIHYDDLEYETEISSLPHGIIIDFIYSAFHGAEKNKPEVKLDDDEYYMQFETQKYDFTVFLSQSGLPLEITDSKNGISAIIKNVTLI